MSALTDEQVANACKEPAEETNVCFKEQSMLKLYTKSRIAFVLCFFYQSIWQYGGILVSDYVDIRT